MHLEKTLIVTAVAGIACSASLSAQAALLAGSVLAFDAGVLSGSTAISGSYFRFEPYGDFAMSMHNGIIIGAVQTATGSHPGAPDGSESPDIDNPVPGLFSNTTMHQSLSPITVVNNDVNNDGGFTQTLDFSGWGVTWNGIPNIALGGGIQDCGTSSDGICVNGSGVDIAGTFNNGSGLATITCTIADCANGSAFTLNYTATGAQGDTSNFDGVVYVLHMEGQINTVPIPASAWLFGSGIIGLLGVARRKATQVTR